MKVQLQQAAEQCPDLPDAPPPTTTYTARVTGRRGRPRKEMHPSLLEASLQHAPKTHLESIYDCSSRTLRRRALEYGLEMPGEPVYVDVVDEDGRQFRVFASKNPTSRLSDISDTELDELVLYIITAFPAFGRRMIDGHLKYMGQRVPRARVEASYSRVVGVPRQGFGVRRIERRVYKVAGPNALWHHDGQHGELTFMT
jgi:hypothetical protein